MEPDRHGRAQARDQRVGDAGFGLGERPRPRVLLRAARAERLPAPREVAVEVDAVRVLAGACGLAVGIDRRDHPEIDPALRTHCDKALDDRHAGRLVAVDAADDDRLAGRVRVAELERVDRSAQDRPAE